MRSIAPNPNKRDYLLPVGCKDLVDVLQGQTKKIEKTIPTTMYQLNGKILSPEVCVIEQSGKKLGIMPLADALQLVKSQSLDLVEIDPDAKPPICIIIDFGKLRYMLSKRKRNDT